MVERCRKIEKSPIFQRFIIGVIILASILVGAETYHSFYEAHHQILHGLDKAILGIFTFELLVKLIARGSRPQDFFKDGWNVFDFLVVTVCYLPVSGQYVSVLRLARVMRILRLVSAIPKLQVLVGALFKSIPSMGYVSILLFLFFYAYSVCGTMFFGVHDAEHFGTLHISMLTMFRVVTLEGWTELMYINMKEMPLGSPLFFVSFILVGTMVIMNLFIGIIMKGMEEAQREQDEDEKSRREGEARTVHHDLEEMTQKMDELAAQIAQLNRRLRSADPAYLGKRAKPETSREADPEP
ncbi:MAG: hypothetical protein RL095_1172 [Verrucomicrobiota bacterium]|jgi:voltage-gated sodium channel